MYELMFKLLFLIVVGIPVIINLARKAYMAYVKPDFYLQLLEADRKSAEHMARKPFKRVLTDQGELMQAKIFYPLLIVIILLGGVFTIVDIIAYW